MIQYLTLKYLEIICYKNYLKHSFGSGHDLTCVILIFFYQLRTVNIRLKYMQLYIQCNIWKNLHTVYPAVYILKP